MKLVFLVCEGLADEPLPELGGKTPLEAAQTPHLDYLARTGRVGRATFIPHGFGQGPDIALMSIAGMSPKAFYEGVAPYEALALGIPLKDGEVIFRCDLVTVSENKLVDPQAGGISEREAAILRQVWNQHLSDDRFSLIAGGGYKNFLIVRDPVLARRQDFVRDLAEKAKALFENHEVNRVRVDLGENPANAVWLWGQGQSPKLPGFRQKFERSAAMVAQASFAKGLAMALGVDLSGDIDEAIKNHDVTFIYRSWEGPRDLTAKVRLIENFDAEIVGKAVGRKKWRDELRVCVTTDALRPVQGQADFLPGHVPFLVGGIGFLKEDGPLFNERTASQSDYVFEDGYKLMESLLIA